MQQDQHENLKRIAGDDVRQLVEKAAVYGDSWRRRGGVGAFMMLARKWDRIEKAMTENGYDVFKGCVTIPGEDGLLDDIGDLRRYLLLVEEHVRSHSPAVRSAERSTEEPGQLDLFQNSEVAHG